MSIGAIAGLPLAPTVATPSNGAAAAPDDADAQAASAADGTTVDTGTDEIQSPQKYEGIEGAATSDQMKELDPPPPAGPNGWTPSELRYVASGNPDGLLSSAWQFATNPVAEQPGQRLSQSMVDQLAPFFSQQFKVDEDFVRDQLERVYIYVGGPTAGQHMAMTFDHHIFVPTDEKLDRIMSERGTRWLTHELAHTMQFAVYARGSRMRAISNYIKGMAVGHNPDTPGTGGGPFTWGALFTGATWAIDPESDPSEPAGNIRQRVTLSYVPAVSVGAVGGLAAAGGIAATRKIGSHFLGMGGRAPGALNSVGLGAALITAPLILGTAAGRRSDEWGSGTTQVLGALGGLATGAVGLGFTKHLLRGGAPSIPGWRGGALKFGGLALAGFAGWMSSRITSNTLSGWNTGIKNINELRGDQTIPDDLQDALHDAHWLESDAQAVALTFVKNEYDPKDAEKYDGVEPTQGVTLKDYRDWALVNPFLIAGPMAVGAGGAIMGGRLVGGTVKGLGSGNAIRAVTGNAWATLLSKQRGPLNSLFAGGAITLAPAVIGGLTGLALPTILGDKNTAPLSIAGGGAAAGLTAMGLSRWLLGPTSPGVLSKLPRLAGVGIGVALGTLAAGAAYKAVVPPERSYTVNEPAPSPWTIPDLSKIGRGPR